MKCIVLFIMGFMFFSCKESGKERMGRLVREWEGREIVYPNNTHFTVFGNDTNYFSKSEYTIVTYVDSVGCTSCKLHLPEWKRLINQLDSIKNTSVLFFLHSKNEKEMAYIFKRDDFTHPVCLDNEDAFNKLNKFPAEMMFQTFLLDRDNKVIAMGNPIHSPKVKDLYLKIILGDKAPKKEINNQTTVVCKNNIIDMGKFNWQQEQKTHFTLENTGNGPLAIIDVITSCGCTSVVYSKEPIRPGNSIEFEVHYKADHPEHFNKTINVYCNSASSPIKLEIKGSAE